MKKFIPSLWIQLIVIFTLNQGGKAISCYKCQSRNGMDSACESGSSSAPFEDNCRYRAAGRQTYFPGEYCVKIQGRLVPSRESIVIRDCDERPFNRFQPTLFMFRGMNINGTQSSCKTDYCNQSSRLAANTWQLSIVTIIAFILLVFVNNQPLLSSLI